MTLTNVETFEHDIATEIIKKESTISRVTSPENVLVADVTDEVNPKPKERSSSALLIEIVIVVLLLVGVGGYFGYTYFMKPKAEPTPVATGQTKTTPAPVKNSFAKTFPDLDTSIGRFVTRMDKNPYGFALVLTEYTPVFSYTIKSEEELARAIARALPTGVGGGEQYTFTDVTISNQNMRVGISGSSTVAYAFIGTNTLIISTSTEGLSSIASGIIK